MMKVYCYYRSALLIIIAVDTYLLSGGGVVAATVSTLRRRTATTTSLVTIPKQQQGFEGDLIAVQRQILQSYGKKVAKELKKLKILERTTTNGNNDDDNDDGNDENFKNTSSATTVRQWYNNRWPQRDDDDGGRAVVYYVFDPSFAVYGEKATVVEAAIREIEDATKVLKFKESNSNTKHHPLIRITSLPVQHEKSLKEYLRGAIPYKFDCWSYVGYQQGADEQLLNLGSACLTKGYIQHEILHTLGLWHESSRYDRDDNIQIMWEKNVWPGLKYDFHKRIVDDTLGLPYDYESIMHHDDKQDFAPNFLMKGGGGGDSDSMVANNKTIGQLDALSNGDVLKLRLLYQCKSGPRNFSNYQQHRCTEDCKCWKKAKGCGVNDDACQGNLICKKNRCVVGNTSSQQLEQEQDSTPEWLLRIYHLILAIALLTSVVFVFKYVFLEAPLYLIGLGRHHKGYRRLG